MAVGAVAFAVDPVPQAVMKATEAADAAAIGRRWRMGAFLSVTQGEVSWSDGPTNSASPYERPRKRVSSRT
ncbi:hypothetical protein GCM10022206_56120 [Streptomyces chiangmaiensis]